MDHFFGGPVFIGASPGTTAITATFDLAFSSFPITKHQDVVSQCALRMFRIVIFVRPCQTMEVNVSVQLDFAFKADDTHVGSAKPTVDCWLSRSNVFTDTRPVSHPPLTHHSRPSVGYPSGSARGPVVGCPSVARLRWRQCRPSGGRQHERDGERRAPRRRRQIPRRRPMATVSSRSAGDRRTHLFLVFCLIFQKVLFLRDFFGRDSEIALLS